MTLNDLKIGRGHVGPVSLEMDVRQVIAAFGDPVDKAESETSLDLFFGSLVETPWGTTPAVWCSFDKKIDLEVPPLRWMCVRSSEVGRTACGLQVGMRFSQLTSLVNALYFYEPVDLWLCAEEPGVFFGLELDANHPDVLQRGPDWAEVAANVDEPDSTFLSLLLVDAFGRDQPEWPPKALTYRL